MIKIKWPAWEQVACYYGHVQVGESHSLTPSTHFLFTKKKKKKKNEMAKHYFTHLTNFGMKSETFLQ